MHTIARPILVGYLFLFSLLVQVQAQTLVQKADGTVPVLIKGVTLGVDITRPNASIYYLNAKPDTVGLDNIDLKINEDSKPISLTAPVVAEKLFGTYLSVKNDDDQASTFAIFGGEKLKPQVRAGILYGQTRDLDHRLTTHPVVIGSFYDDTLKKLANKVQRPVLLRDTIKIFKNKIDSLRFASACLSNDTLGLATAINKLLDTKKNADSCLAVPKIKQLDAKLGELKLVHKMLNDSTQVWQNRIRKAKADFPISQTDSIKASEDLRTLGASRRRWLAKQDILDKKLLITQTWYIGANLSTSSFNYLPSTSLSKFTSSLVEDSLAVAYDFTAGLNYHIGRDWFIGLSVNPGWTNNLASLKSKAYTRKDSFKNDSLSIEKTETYNAVTGNYQKYWHLPSRLDLLYNIPISQADSAAAVLVYAGLEYRYPTNINVRKVIPEQINLQAGLYLFTGRKQRFVGGLQFGIQDIGNNGYWLKVQTDPTAKRLSFGERFTVSIVGRITLARLGGLSDFFNGIRKPQ
ncbi:hypothetical protein WBJ53_05370 [Spirosoma sp. SC4-14]|uniref:hypothetical protein n=1 Tax=Spirosoma sp. SC4-14 TaxID=3128900 RepID=UPI0030CE9DA9